MPVFTMRCSICDRTFELDRSKLPVHEPAPNHTAVYVDGRCGEVTCPGTNERFMPAPVVPEAH